MFSPIWSQMELQHATEAAKRFETPLYIYSLSRFRHNIRELKQKLGNQVSVCCSVKANPWLAAMGSNCADLIEVCSPGEWRYCLAKGIASERIVLGGVKKTRAELFEAMEHAPHRISVESRYQLADLSDAAISVGKQAKVLLRLSSGNQFGMDCSEIQQIISHREEYPGILFMGLHYYSGTQKKLPNQVLRDIQFLHEAAVSCGSWVQELEYGPGLGVPQFSGHLPDQYRNNLDLLAAEIQKLTDTYKITLECGRLLTADAGVYVATVCEEKHNGGRDYLVVDGGMHQLHYYGQNSGVPIPYLWCAGTAAPRKVTVCGSLCTVSDILAKDVMLGGCAVGEKLVFMNAGAYAATEGISLFLNRDLPAIVMEHDGVLLLLRQHMPTEALNENERMFVSYE